MKLYYTPGACSLAPHIVLREAVLDFEPMQVDLKAKKLADGSDYRAVNPRGSVPALETDDGAILTENAAILQYLGDAAPDSGLLPRLGDFQRYRVIEWLNYIATELHKGFGPLWNPASGQDVREATKQALAAKFDYLEGRLGSGPWLMGDRFTLADAYAFVILSWTRVHHIDLSRWPGLTAYVGRIAQRNAVDSALRAEGLKS